MLHHPDVMKRCQAQIDDVIGRHRSPSMKDRYDMPYVEATLFEVSRMASVVAFGVSIFFIFFSWLILYYCVIINLLGTKVPNSRCYLQMFMF